MHIYICLDEYEPALDWAKLLAKGVKRVHGDSGPETTQAWAHLGRIYFHLDQYEDALGCVHRGLESSRFETESWKPDLRLLESRIVWKQGNHQRGLTLALECYHQRLTTSGPGDQKTRQLTELIANRYYLMNEFSEALKYYLKALDIEFNSVKGASTIDIIDRITRIYMDHLGDNEQAEVWFRRLEQKVISSDGRVGAIIYGTLAESILLLRALSADLDAAEESEESDVSAVSLAVCRAHREHTRAVIREAPSSEIWVRTVQARRYEND